MDRARWRGLEEERERELFVVGPRPASAAFEWEQCGIFGSDVLITVPQVVTVSRCLSSLCRIMRGVGCEKSELAGRA